MSKDSHEEIMRELEEESKKVLEEIEKRRKEAEEKEVYKLAREIKAYESETKKPIKDMKYPIDIDVEEDPYIPNIDYISVKYKDKIVFEAHGEHASDVNKYIPGEWEEDLKKTLREYQKIEEEKAKEEIDRLKEEWGI